VALPTQRRMTLLYQLYLTGQAGRRFMRLALSGSPLSGEDYALYSYLHANGPRTLTRAAADLGLPVTSLATTLAPLISDGQIDRRPHPRDGRARLLSLSSAGRERLQSSMSSFAAAYDALLGELASASADSERVFAALDALRSGIERVIDRLEISAGDATADGASS